MGVSWQSFSSTIDVIHHGPQTHPSKDTLIEPRDLYGKAFGVGQ